MNNRNWAIVVGLVVALGCQNKAPESTEAEAPTETNAAAAEVTETTAPAEEATAEPTGDDVMVTPLEHGSLFLEWDGKYIAVDPVTAALEASEGMEPKADLIVITHIHGDHLDPDAIAKLRKEGTPVIVPKAVAEKAGDKLPNPTILANGESFEAFDGTAKVEAVAMYNLKRKRDNGEFFHPKGMGNGYVLTLGDKRVYISGDTECTPEMKALKDIDMAFVCMNLPYTMTPDEASECIAEFKPKTLYPYHYRGQDPTKLDTLLADSGVAIEYLNWYPNAEGAE